MKEIELDGLIFEVEASSEKASKNIDALTESLKKLRKATSEIRGLSSISTQLSKLSDSLNGFSNRNAKALTKIAFALDALGRVGKIQISPNIGKRITDIADSSKDIKDDDLDRLERLASVLEKLGKVGDVKIPKMKIPKEQVDKRVDQNNVDQKIKAISLRETSLAVNQLQQSLVPLTQIMQTGTDVWAGFEQVINATGESINNVIGYLNEGIIEGTFTRIENVSGLLGDGIQKAIVPAEQFANALAIGETRAITLQNTIEGTWSTLSEGSPAITEINTEFSESISISKLLNSAIHSISQGLGEVKTAVSAVIASLPEIIVIVEFIVKAIKAIVGLIGRIIGLIGKAISFANRLITPFKKLAAYVGKQVISPFEKARNSIKSLTSDVRNLFDSFKRIALYRLVRTLIATLTRGLSEGIHNLYQYSRIMNTEFAKSLDKIATASLYVKNSLAAMVSPIINAIAPAIDFLADKMVGLLNQINMFISALLGKSTYTAAKKLQDTFEKIKSAVIGIDELNIIGDDEVKDYANMFEELPIEDSDITNFVEKLKKAFEEGDWEGLGRLVGDKFNNLIDSLDWAGMGEKIGYYLDGVIKTAYYILDEIDFTNLGEKIADLVNNLIEQVDWEYLGRLLVKQITIVWDLAIGFLKELDWGEVARDIIDFLKGAMKEISEWLDKYDWLELGKVLLGKISDFLKNFDFEGLLRDFSTLVGKAMRSMKDLLTPLWDSFKEWWEDHIKGDNFKETLKNLGNYLVNFVDENIVSPFFNAFFGNEESKKKIDITKTLMENMKNFQNGDVVDFGEMFKSVMVDKDLSLIDKFKTVGQMIMYGILYGIHELTKDQWLLSFFVEPFLGIVCKLFGIHSPAETMKPIGRDIVLGMFEGIDGVMSNIGNWVKDHIVTPLIEGFRNKGEEIKEVAKIIWDKINEGFTNVSEGIKNTASKIWDWMKEGWKNISETVKTLASDIWDWISEGFSNLTESVKQTASKIWGWVSEGFSSISESIKSTASTIWDWISEGFSSLSETIKQTASTIWDWIDEGFSNISETVKQIASTLWGWMSEGFTNISESIKTTASMIWNLVTEGFTNISEKIKSTASTIWGWITEGFTNISENIKSFSVTIWNWMHEGFNNLSENVKTVASTIWNWMSERFGSLKERIKDKGKEIVNNIKEGIESKVETVKDKAKEIGEKIKDALSEKLEPVKTKAKEIGDKIKDALNENIEPVKSKAREIGEKVKEALGEKEQPIKDKATEIGNKIKDALGEKSDEVSTELKTLIHTLEDFLQSLNKLPSYLNSAKTAVGGLSTSLESLSTASKSATSSVSDLINTLKQIPREIKIKFLTDTYTAYTQISTLKTQLDSIPRSITISVNVQVNSSNLNSLRSQLNSFSSVYGYSIDNNYHIDRYGNYYWATGGIAHAMGGIVPHAKGSLIARPTITQYKGQTHLFGEAGREAILPLDSYTGWMDDVADRVEERIGQNDNYGEMTFENALFSFYQTCLEPVMSQISQDTRRQADKNESTVVKIGGRDVRNAYDNQVKVDGYNFRR